MEDFFEEYEVELFGTDDEYEFEASQFYDFTRREFDYEIEEAERWFEVSGDYPYSPFIVKLNLEKLLSVEAVDNHPSEAKYSNFKSISSSNSDTDGRRHGVSSAKKDGNGKGKSYLKPEDHTAKVKLNSADNKLLQPRSTTTTTATTPSFMEPTASHLAKLKLNHNHNSSHICTRFQKTSAKLDQKGSSRVGLDSLATKRQKLDVGYLRKVAHLKHHFSLMHKSPKKLTVPKEPELETMLRAQRRGSKNSCASSETEKCCNFKAHPLNKKILEPRLSPQPRRSPPPLPEFQVFHLKTTERATHHACAKVYPGIADVDIIQDPKRKSTILRESGSTTGDKFLESPPTEHFSKLSLDSDMKTSRASPSGRRSSVKRCGGAKPKQCGGHMRFREAKCWSDMSRNLDIR